MMRKLIVALLIGGSLVFSWMSCNKDEGCTEKTVASEQGAMQAFATTNGFSTVSHSSGIQYNIINPGSGTRPTVSSTVTVNYTGKFMSGSVFDASTSPATFPLANVIAGWQIGIPLIQKGGIIELLIPSSLAYGCAGRSPAIPSYSVLYFRVELVDVL